MIRRMIVVLSLLAASPLLSADEPARTLVGFTPERSVEQLRLEARFDEQIDPGNLREWMKWITSRPHHVGSPHGKAVAEYIAERFRSWGYETRIERFDVLFPTPRTRVLEMVSPSRFRATLAEPGLSEDATSGQRREQLPTYNAYSVDGDVTAELVYVNYGVPDDYEVLAQNGVDVEGKIVIARYGGSWRGIKPKVAAEHGAIACIIYSDPRDDGYFRGDVYPEGAWRSELGAQRGSVEDMPLYPGDPLTPGVGATEGAKRLDLDEAPTLTKIPVLPISYADAKPLLEAMTGSVAPEDWRGALPITYHLGPGPAKVRLKLEFNWDLRPAYDVIAMLPGAERPDEWIMRGNHHDAWVNGAKDPTSGMVALMEEARAVGELVKSGWRPDRTIVYAAWDAEEPGLLGSTEWVEQHAAELDGKLAVYINTDSNGRGFLSAGGSHALERFVNEVADDVTDPQTGVSVGKRRRALEATRGDKPKDPNDRLHLYALGSGSDYTPFLQHLGVSSLNIGFGGEDGGGSYHSIYDSFDHFTRFGDPGFAYGVTLAKVTGRLVLRLAEADLLPFDFVSFSETASRYLDEIETLTQNLREETSRRNELIENGTLQLAADPTKPFELPEKKEEIPYFNFAPIENALTHLSESAAAYHEGLEKQSVSASPETRRKIDSIVMRSERLLTNESGLPGRHWFRHQIYAPGFYTGYGVKTFPAVREAIEQREFDRVDAGVANLASALERFADSIDEAVKLME